jgi:cell fate (sporulation/competence/biofilm development) regulator YlbF (YheA/YmcA/DUF963 family)
MARSMWTVASELAEVLRETPQMQNFRRAFDDENLRVRLSHLTATYSALREHELLLGVRLNHMGPVIEDWMESDQDRRWLESAIDAGTGFQVAIEYLRSHLPRYPYLQVPHLRRGSPLDFADGALLIDYFPWQREMRSLGFAPDTPPNMDGLGGTTDFTDLLRELADALKESESWRRFEVARYAMSDEDWVALKELSASFYERMKKDVVNAEAGHYLVEKFAFRMRELTSVVSAAEGAVGEYLASFEAVHQLITVVAGFMETLIIKGYLPLIEPYRMDIGPGLDLRQVELATIGDDPFQRGGEVLFVRGPAVSSQGLLYARGHSHRWPRIDEPERSTMVVEGWFVREQIEVEEKMREAAREDAA